MDPREAGGLPGPVGCLVLLFLAGLILVALRGPADPPAPGGVGEGIAPLFTPEVRRWSARIRAWGRAYNLDPNLIATVMQIESCGNPRARSPRGALGLFQVMPFHFGAGEDPLDPETNARVGLSVLAEMLRRAGGDVAQALAGYNGGPAVIGRPERWTAETRRYVHWGTGIYADARRGASRSPRLEEWLRAGGRSLCGR